MLGIVLPINFNTPFRATSMVDFEAMAHHHDPLFHNVSLFANRIGVDAKIDGERYALKDVRCRHRLANRLYVHAIRLMARCA